MNLQAPTQAQAQAHIDSIGYTKHNICSITGLPIRVSTMLDVPASEVCIPELSMPIHTFKNININSLSTLQACTLLACYLNYSPLVEFTTIPTNTTHATNGSLFESITRKQAISLCKQAKFLLWEHYHDDERNAYPHIRLNSWKQLPTWLDNVNKVLTGYTKPITKNIAKPVCNTNGNMLSDIYASMDEQAKELHGYGYGGVLDLKDQLSLVSRLITGLLSSDSIAVNKSKALQVARDYILEAKATIKAIDTKGADKVALSDLDATGKLERAILVIKKILKGDTIHQNEYTNLKEYLSTTISNLDTRMLDLQANPLSWTIKGGK